MLYLTLGDDPFPTQEHDETALLELVRAVARRDGDDRTISELIRFQDALERLGLLWTPLDALDKYQAQELVRNLHLELTAPGDMVYLKHTPAMRSYVVLRGVVLLTNNVLDREGIEGVRALGPGNEFGQPLDPDLDLDKPVADFLEYAKAPHLDVLNDGGGDVAALTATRGGSRKDGRAELLVIGRQDWIATLQTCSDHFSRFLKKASSSKDPDPLKDRARVAFNHPAKGREGEHLEVATRYLRERVAFCSDLPLEQVLAMAAGVELRGFTVPGRDVFRRGRECYGEAYIMFTGSADQKGSDKSGDRLIKEGDLFGDEHFAVATKGDLGTPFRTATAMTRTAPCELLVIPARECRRLQAYVAVRNSEKAMAIFDKFFINLPREAFSEIALLATFRTIKMHELLAVAGEDVVAVFFVFRGECAASQSGKRQQRKQVQQKRKDNTGRPKAEQQRYGPGHIVGWPYLMPNAPTLGRGPTTTARKGASHEAAVRTPPKHASDGHAVSDVDAGGQLGKPQQEVLGLAKKRRPRRNVQEWEETVTVTAPAQVLSVPLTTLLSFLSERAMQGLRAYISMTHKQKLEETSRNLDDDDLDVFGQGVGVGWSGPSASGQFSKAREETAVSPCLSDRRRPSTAPQLSPKKHSWDPVIELHSPRRPNTTAVTFGGHQVVRRDLTGGSCSSRHHSQLQVRGNTPTRWRWRIGLTDVEAARNRSSLSRGSRSSSRQRRSSLSMSSVIWGFARGGRGQEGCGRRNARDDGGGRCSCPLKSCRVCSPSKRLERLRHNPVWVPSRSHRSDRKPGTAPATTTAQSDRGDMTRNTKNAGPGSAGWRPSTHGPATTTKRLGEVGSLPSFKLRCNTSDAFGITMVTSASSGRISTGVKRLDVRGGTPSSGQRGSTVVAAPTSDFGVTTASAGDRRKADDGSEMSLPPAAAAVKAPDRQPGGRLSYSLVQLSTRAALNPGEAEAGLCLRILGSFASEAEATTRVLHLYHSVLPGNVTWQRCLGTAGEGGDQVVSPCLNHSDHLFLLRKGVVSGRISFDVDSEVAEINHICCGDHSNTCGNSNYDSSTSNTRGRLVGKGNREEDTGRGYDASIPAVFKAKGQQFAVAFVSSADRAGKDWDRHQDQLLAMERSGGLSKSRSVEGTEHIDDDSNSSSHPASPSDGVSPHVEEPDESDGGSSALDEGQAAEIDEDDGGARQETVSARGDGIGEGGEAPSDNQNEKGAGTADGGNGCPGMNAADHVPGTDHGDEASADGADDRWNDAARIVETDEDRREQMNGRGDGGQDARETETAAFGGKPPGSGAFNAGNDGTFGDGAGPSLFADELLDASDTESSEGLEGEGGRRRGCQRGTGGRRVLGLHVDETSDDGSGGDVRPEEQAHDGRAVLSWIVGRMGLLEEVEGCYETEAKAFKKAIEILEGKEKALASTEIHAGPTHPHEENHQTEHVLSGRCSPLSRQPQAHSPQRRYLSPRTDNRVACILPLYEWLSLGNGLEGVFKAIESRSIADPSEAARAGVDPLSLWTEQRARRLRTNLYNLLRAAGPREIRSRCGVAVSGGGRRGSSSSGKKSGRRAGDKGGVPLAGDDGIVGQRKLRGLGRKKAEKEAVRSARASVLRQNQKLIQTETNARRRLVNALPTETSKGAAHSQQRHPQPHVHASEVDSAAAARSTETSPIADGPGSVDRAGMRSGTGSGGGGGGGSLEDQGGPGKRGVRHELRVQMNIERKRARLFEDIQTLPYIGARRGTKATKAGNKGGVDDRSNKRQGFEPIDQARQGRTGAPPPAITLRAPKVQAEKRLHGKAPSSFFSRAHATAGSTLALTSGTTVTPEEGHHCSTPPTVATVAAAAEAYHGSPTEVEQRAAAGVAAEVQPTQSAAGLEPGTGPASAASIFSACPSTLGSSVSTLNGEQDVAGQEPHFELPTGANESSNDKENVSLSEKPQGALKPRPSGGKPARAGGRCLGLKAARARGGDGWSTSRVPEGVCSLDEELILLDGILHDRKIRTWVETTLAPSRKHHRHHYRRHHA